MYTKVRDIDWKHSKYQRAGIIPFVIQDGVIFFAFGIEPYLAAIGDFGGGRELSDYDALDTALREYQEEALNVFGVLNREILQDCIVLQNNRTIEILVHIPGPFYKYTQLFRELVGTNTTHEIQSIIWMSRSQLLNALTYTDRVDGNKIYFMYDKIRNVLLENIAIL